MLFRSGCEHCVRVFIELRYGSRADAEFDAGVVREMVLGARPTRAVHDGLGGAELLGSGAGLEGEGPGGGGCGDGSELGSVERRRNGYRSIDVTTGLGRISTVVPSRRRVGRMRRLGSNGGSGGVRTGHADGESGHDVCL